MTSETNDETPLLDIHDLSVTFRTSVGEVKAVRGADLRIYPGQSVAIVGESGSGKSTLAHAIIDLLPGTGKVTGGSIVFDGKEMVGAPKKDVIALRGREIGLVPQDPMSNLNPVWRIGFQVKEALKANNVDVTRASGRKLEQALGTGVDDPERIVSHEDMPAIAEAFAKTGSPKADELLGQVVPGATTLAQLARMLEQAGGPQAAQDVGALLAHAPSMNDRVAGLLAEAGLPDAAARAKQYPHEFSGGMRQRALIAIGLAARPKLLIADEPTSALDVTVQRRILDHLGEMTHDLGTAVLFITHDLGLAAERAERVVVMYRGQIVEAGPSVDLLTNPQHPYTKRLVAAAPSLASHRIQAAKREGKLASDLLAATGGDGISHQRDDILIVKDLVKEFNIRGSRPGSGKMFRAVDEVSFVVKRGTTTALVGESGSGKSTVANMVLRLLTPTSGSIMFEGTDIAALSGKELFNFRRRVQPIFQDPYGSLDPMYSIFRTIEEPLRVHKIGTKKEREEKVRDLLEKVALPASVMRRFPNELSGGQRQRVAVARALALDPEVVICDEAVSALDVLVQAQILDLLGQLQNDLNLTYLFITHDLAVVRQIADQVCVMQTGKLVEKATTDEVFDNPQQQYTRDLLEAIPGASIDFVPAGPEALED